MISTNFSVWCQRLERGDKVGQKKKMTWHAKLIISLTVFFIHISREWSPLRIFWKERCSLKNSKTLLMHRSSFSWDLRMNTFLFLSDRHKSFSTGSSSFLVIRSIKCHVVMRRTSFCLPSYFTLDGLGPFSSSWFGCEFFKDGCAR